RGRIGYSNDVYNALVGYGLAPGNTILDVGCGTGLASGPLIENRYRITGIDPSEPMIAIAKRNFPSATWQVAKAENLPFKDASFDAVVSAQTFHRVDADAAIAEVRRVLRPGGIVAIWWKSIVTGDELKRAREAVAAELGATAIATKHPPFKAFYAATWSETSLRVLPWRPAMTLRGFMEYERSRAIVRERFSDPEPYFTKLEERLHQSFGPGDPLIPLSYSQYLYLAKK
ncbi:MAG TPA: class I SAM-dependent methyltransferase, partial [Candidatus Baltobacteraceae bacterium]|nr:class I SAM-dependent methyltransferase [Candidatus Baltobacteraceae bacterium]